MNMVTEDIARFDAQLSMNELAAQLRERELLVQPLSARTPIAAWLAEGGLGYGALNEGSFAASICRVKTDLVDYGSDYQALYNVGYPLHRMAEGQGSALTEPLGTAKEITAYLCKAAEPVAVFAPAETFPMDAPADASDFLVVNNAAAPLMGLETAGTVALYSREIAPEAGQVKRFWEKRFIEDAVPAGSYMAKYLTQRSGAKAIFEMAKESNAVFFALFCYTGVLVLLAGSEAEVKPLEESLAAQPLTWKLGEAPTTAENHGHH